MAALNDFSSPHKFFQENAKEIKDMYKQVNKQMTPLLQKYLLGRTMSGGVPKSVENRRSGQQADNLVWQQEMFHKILMLQGLLKEGLAYEEELCVCRKDVLGVVTTAHPNGEWADFTRDKLLFLQDLFRSGCISETEYHASKSPILSRLADQGALIDSQDFVMLVSPPPPKGTVGHDAPDCRASLRIAADAAAEAGDISGEGYSPMQKLDTDPPAPRKTPIKQMLEAMTRLKNNRGNWGLDSGPTREAPSPPVGRLMISKDALKAALLGQTIPVKQTPNEHESLEDDEPLNTLYASPAAKKSSLSASPSMGTRRMGSLLAGLVRKYQGETVQTHENYSPLNTAEDDPKHEGEPKSSAFPPDRVLREGTNGQGPDTVKLKRKVNARGPPTNFFIDKLRQRSSDTEVVLEKLSHHDHNKTNHVLGDNIKTELARIRAEIDQTNPGQTFTNDQIDAIATRLPVEKVELQRFFPKSWCDKYGDIVLEVVHKEFKDHVGEMENQRRIGKQQRKAVRVAREKAAEAALVENDENSNNINLPSTLLVQNLKAGVGASPMKKSSKANLNQCFTTGDGTPTEAKAKLPLIEESPDRANRGQLGFEEEMDGKLTAALQRMPSQRFNISLR